jgi:DNA-binding transcriptional MerR regulator
VRSHEVAELAGISFRQLDHWIRQGWIRTETASGGSGSQRSFSQLEAKVAITAGELLELGLKAAEACEYARLMVEAGTHAVEAHGWIIARDHPDVVEGAGAGPELDEHS